MKRKGGFTLLELIIVIAILGILMAMVSANYVTSLKRGKDIKRKAEATALKTALQLYHQDYGSYPTNSSAATFYKINGCGASGTTTCPDTINCPTVDFGAGNAACTSVVYMKKLPAQYGTANGMYYHQLSSGSDFCAHIPLEITTDGDIAKSKARCSSCSSYYGTNDYVVCSE